MYQAVVSKLLVRSVYFLGMPFGTFDAEVGLQVVFSDLPALLFMIAIVGTGTALLTPFFFVSNSFS